MRQLRAIRQAERLGVEFGECEYSLIVCHESGIQRLSGGGDNGIREFEAESFPDLHRMGFDQRSEFDNGDIGKKRFDAFAFRSRQAGVGEEFELRNHGDGVLPIRKSILQSSAEKIQDDVRVQDEGAHGQAHSSRNRRWYVSGSSES
mgnify:FL=1